MKEIDEKQLSKLKRSGKVSKPLKDITKKKEVQKKSSEEILLNEILEQLKKNGGKSEASIEAIKIAINTLLKTQRNVPVHIPPPIVKEVEVEKSPKAWNVKVIRGSNAEIQSLDIKVVK